MSFHLQCSPASRCFPDTPPCLAHPPGCSFGGHNLGPRVGSLARAERGSMSCIYRSCKWNLTETAPPMPEMPQAHRWLHRAGFSAGQDLVVPRSHPAGLWNSSSCHREQETTGNLGHLWCRRDIGAGKGQGGPEVIPCGKITSHRTENFLGFCQCWGVQKIPPAGLQPCQHPSPSTSNCSTESLWVGFVSQCAQTALHCRCQGSVAFPWTWHSHRPGIPMDLASRG